MFWDIVFWELTVAGFCSILVAYMSWSEHYVKFSNWSTCLYLLLFCLLYNLQYTNSCHCFLPEMCPIYCLSYSIFWNFVDLFFAASLSFKISRASSLSYGSPVGWNDPLLAHCLEQCSSLLVDAAEYFSERYNLFIINNCWLGWQFFLSHFRVSLIALHPILLLPFGPAHAITVFQTLVHNYQPVCHLSFHRKSENADNIVMKKTWNPELSIPDGELSEFTMHRKHPTARCKVSSSSLLKSSLVKWWKLWLC